MALNASKISSGPVLTKRTNTSRSQGSSCSFAKASTFIKSHPECPIADLRKSSQEHFLTAKLSFSSDEVCKVYGRPTSSVVSRRSLICLSTRTRNTDAKECDDLSDISSESIGEEKDIDQAVPVRMIDSNQGIAEACKYVYNDAKFVNERARNDIVLLSREIMRLDARARQDVAMIGSGFLRIDARAREDTEKFDRNVKKKAERLHHIATILEDKARSKLKSAADRHWSDGALEADLRRADLRAKKRAMEDSFMALEFVKNIHDMMVQKINCPLQRQNGMLELISLKKNGKARNFFPGEVSTARITAIQEAYLSMASALSEADGIDYTDPEELELLVAALIDLDAMDGKSSASLLAECSSSPDENTRQALANALAAAPSMWTLGNAGMGALQRLAEDSNPEIAAAASNTIYELKKQWEIEEGDSWRFMMNLKPQTDVDNEEPS